jgi:hypothetical protein
MNDRRVLADKPASEAIATAGLFLNVASVIAIAVSLASWGGNAALAIVGGVVAVISFVASIVCFGVQAADPAPQPVEAK